jgi:hypothetical protein
VERINQFEIYELGQTLEKLRAFSGDVAPQVVMSEIFEARSALQRLLQGQPIPAGVSLVRAKELFDTIAAIIDAFFFQDGPDGKRAFKFPEADGPKIDSWWWNSITPAIEKFEIVLAEEMRENPAYNVPRRGIFYTKALVDSADETFPSDLRLHIPEKTRDDWKSAGRCLAFNLLSASGFHVARAVEGTLERYYQVFCSKPPGETLHSWNDYIQALETARKAKVDPVPTAKTLAELRQMKDDYRNPIAHPRIVLSEADARMLFANGESLIIGMALELAEVAKSGVQPALALVAPTGTP